MSTEEKFRACVNVIRNLPKHGPVNPSHQVMLKFYAYFKQATEGPNKSSKPPFWDLVRKAKWDAWTKLGDMDTEVAMQLYVEEFKKIVDTVSKTNADMDKAEIDNFYASVPMNDLELLVGPTLARSRSNSPVHSESSCEDHSNLCENLKQPTKVNSSDRTDISTNKEEITLQNGNCHISPDGSLRIEDEEEEEYFLDTIENTETSSVKSRFIEDRSTKIAQYPYMNGYSSQHMKSDGSHNSNRALYYDQETSEHLTSAITSLQKDLEKVVSSVNLIEQRISQLQGKILSKKVDRSLSITSSPMTMAVLLAWPVLIQLLFYWFRRKNR